MTTGSPKRIDAGNFDERTLLLLGVLLMETQHGYQINDFIERRLQNVISMKKPTAYALLDRLAKTEAVNVYTEQEGSRPPRKMYQITPAGRELFLDLLRRNLAESELPGYASDIGLMFMNHLGTEEVISHLQIRLDSIQTLLNFQPLIPSHGPNLRLDLPLDHKRAIQEAERDWLLRTIEKLRTE